MFTFINKCGSVLVARKLKNSYKNNMATWTDHYTFTSTAILYNKFNKVHK